MAVRLKIILIVLPLLVFSMAIAGLSSALAARNGLTAIAVKFLGFKAEELEGFAQNQWSLLVNNNLQFHPELVEVTREAVSGHAVQMTRSPTELTLAVWDDGTKAFANQPFRETDLSAAEKQALADLALKKTKGWVTLALKGVDRVGFAFHLDNYEWQVMVTEAASEFYAPVNQILTQTAVVLALTVALSVLLLIVFSGILTRPLGKVVLAMDRIIESGDLSERVEVRYDDEIGKLAHTFNAMMIQLDGAYRQVKTYALDAVMAKRNEQKIRLIFQKYVPASVIDQIFAHPEKMLVGNMREVAILFTDIRSFTTISEEYKPDELVSILNRYFSIIVELIIQHRGVVDKYIGDAVMAFFGAPAHYENDAADALKAGLGIVAGLEQFNANQKASGFKQFLTGIGINFGEVTVGNIGTESKMDYTVIGDNVNLASRLEGLTKEYKVPILLSESLIEKAGPLAPYRLVDTVVVKGKTRGERIYTAALNLPASVRASWEQHNAAIGLFYERQFAKAGRMFAEVARALSGDYLSDLYVTRCRTFEANPPPEGWTGNVTMDHK